MSNFKYQGDLPTLDYPLNTVSDSEPASKQYLDACLLNAKSLKQQHSSEFFAVSCGKPEITKKKESGDDKNGTWSYRVKSKMRLWLTPKA